MSETTLAQRWREAREAFPTTDGEPLSQNALDRMIGRPGSKLSQKVEDEKTATPLFDSVLKAAQVLGVRPGWLAFGIGPRVGGDEIERLAELPAITFLSKLLSLQTLISEVQGNPHKDWRLWHLAGVVDDYRRNPGLADQAGNPVHGTWAEVLDERAGRLPKPKVVGNVDHARRSHRKEHPRKRPPT